MSKADLAMYAAKKVASPPVPFFQKISGQNMINADILTPGLGFIEGFSLIVFPCRMAAPTIVLVETGCAWYAQNYLPINFC